MAFELCKTCGGSGRISDPSRSVCPACGGSGQLTAPPPAPEKTPEPEHG